MSRFLALFLATPVLFAGCVADDESTIDQAATGELGLHGAPEPHEMPGRGEAGPPTGGGSSPLMTWHSGPVLHANLTQAIFMGGSWNDAAFAGDKISGMDSFFEGFGDSNYAKLSTEYTDSAGAVTSTSTYLGHVVDTTEPPRKALSTSQAIAEACKITNNQPDPNGVYFIFTSTGAGHVNYCAWHSWGTCTGGARIQVAYMPNIDGLAGCDPTGTLSGTNGHSQGLTAVANVTAHELSEAITDPRGNAWYDSSGAENGDKCAWKFNGIVSFPNGSQWTLQQEWSNAAYTASAGSPRGCLQGN